VWRKGGSVARKKKVLLLGASGLVGPHIISGLEQHYDLRLADVKPHPDGRSVHPVDIAVYEQVLEAARGVEAIMNFTVNRSHPELSFAVNVTGAYHVFRAAAELGIRKVVHTGPQLVMNEFQHDFDIEDPPLRPSTGYYDLTKYLSVEMCRIYARACEIQVVCFLFAGLKARPEAPVTGEDFPPFCIIWEDLVEACRLAVEIESVPGGFQFFNMHSYQGHGKHLLDKAERILGYKPRDPVEQYYRRPE
jgi:NAD-dependent epimerase/dehydratase family protein